MSKQPISWLAVAVCLVLSGSAVSGQIIYDNASTLAGAVSPYGIVTDPGAGAGGFDASVLVTPDTIFGFGHAGGNTLAEDFVVPAGTSWTITGAHVFGYVTGATVPATTAGVMRILDSPPNGTPVVLGGDLTTNRLMAGSNVFRNIYRTLVTDIGTATTRRIQDHILTFATPLVLGPGTYWFEYGLTGNNFVPPLQVSPRMGGLVTGNALQFQVAGGAYAAVVDGTIAKGIPFQLIGYASLQATTAVSRKTHGAVAAFDINLPLSGSPGIECRSGGVSNVYQVIIAFSNNVVSGSASVTAPFGGSVLGTPTFSGNTMTINLTGVTDVQQITVNATNVTDEFSQVLPNASVPMKVLIGDSAGSGNSTVAASDIGFVKSVSGQPTSGVNFRADVVASGSIGSTDISLVKSASGHSLP